MMNLVTVPRSVADGPSLPQALPCPLCSETLRRDPWRSRPSWYCGQGHGYTNAKVLLPSCARVGGRQARGGGRHVRCRQHPDQPRGDQTTSCGEAGAPMTAPSWCGPGSTDLVGDD